jgi:hypothetical protein
MRQRLAQPRRGELREAPQLEGRDRLFPRAPGAPGSGPALPQGDPELPRGHRPRDLRGEHVRHADAGIAASIAASAVLTFSRE